MHTAWSPPTKDGKVLTLYQDDARAFFGRPLHLVSDADIMRWRAAVEALRAETGEGG